MFQTGSQINPSLGRTDYSAYAQGAIAGGQAIGQGIANLGQGLASGIEAYTKKKEENKKLDDATSVVSNLVKSDPKIAAFFNLKPNESGEYDLKAIKSAVKTVGAGPILQLAQQNQEFNRTQENESRTAQAALALGGVGMGPVLPENRASVLESRGFTPQQITAAQAYDLNRQAKLAELNKTAAETAALGVPKAPNFSFQEKAYNAEKAARELKLRRPLNQAEDAKLYEDLQGRTVEQKPSPRELANVELGTTRTKANLEALDLKRSSSIAQGASANQIIKALDSGKASTGVFANVFSIAKRIGEGVGLQDLGATESEILDKGLAALNAAGLRSLASGLGSMSNADREFFTAGMPSITNKEQTIRYYAEMAKANAAFAKEDGAYFRKQEAAGVEYGDIISELEQRQESRNVAESIYSSIIEGKPVPQVGATTKVGRFQVIEVKQQ